MPFQIPISEAFGKPAQGQFGFGRDHDARRILIQPMHNAGAFFPANAGQFIPRMGQQRIDQRAILIARRRVHDEPRGLVQNDQVGILMKNAQRNVLRLGQGRDGGGDFQGVKRAHANGLGGFFQGMAVPAGMARHNQGLDAGARERTYRVSKEAVGALAGSFLGRAEFVAFSVQKGGLS